MTRMLRRLWQRHPLIAAGFGMAVLASLVFALRGAMFAAMLWMRAEQPVEGWMTPRFIALAYGLPVYQVEQTLGLTDTDARGHSLDRLAREQGRPVADLMEPLNTAIRAKAAE